MPEGTINGKPYPIAVNEQGQTLWRTVAVAQEKDEEFRWSLGAGETERRTGRGYHVANGFDASEEDVLHLSPHYLSDNNTSLTTGYGYGLEQTGIAAATLTEDVAAHATGTSAITESEVTFDQVVTAGNSNRMLEIDIAAGSGGLIQSVTYAGLWMCTRLVADNQDADTSAAIYYLLDPPVGTHEVKVVYASNRVSTVGAVVWHGVNQDTPFGTAITATGTSTSPALDVDTGAGEYAVACLCCSENRTSAVGTNETEQWNVVKGATMVGQGSIQDGDTEDPAEFRPTVSGAGSPPWCIVGVSIKPASTTSQSYVFIGDADYVWRYTYDSDGGPVKSAAGSGSQQVASGVAGQPAKMNGYWYMPFASGANAQKLTNPAHATAPWAATTGTWKADHLAAYQQGVNPTLARVNSTNRHTVELNVDTGDVDDTWTAGTGKVGNTTAKVTALAESQGFLFPATELALYDYGLECETRPITRFLTQGKIDADNGKYTMSFGDIIVYPCADGLLRYRIGIGVLPIGIDDIDGFRRVTGIDSPLGGRPAFLFSAGKYWYVGWNKGQDTWLLQYSPGETEGEYTVHTVLTVPLSRGGFVDSDKCLWLKGASDASNDRDVRVIELDANGSLRKPLRRGQASATHTIKFDERNPGRPQDKVQLTHFTVELAGPGWDATNCYLQPKVWLDDATAGVAFGAAISSTGVTVNKPTTFGTSDSCNRFRPELSVPTSSSYTPITSDPQTLRVIVGIRFPEIIEIVVPADEAVLEGMTSIDAEQNLRRLQNRGVVAFGRPGEVSTFNAEVIEVTDVMYQNTAENYMHGLKLRVQRWITD